jgi:hypothetical protein
MDNILIALIAKLCMQEKINKSLMGSPNSYRAIGKVENG